MSLPSYEAFRQALVDPALRPQIGLVIGDDDAQSLAGNEEWARNYFDAWIAMAPAVAAAPAAASAPDAASAPTEPFGEPAQAYAAAPTEPFANPAQPYAAAPGQPGAPKKKGLPGWALAVIIGGAALVLLGGVGVAALVIGTLNDVQENASASSQADEQDEVPAPEETDAEEFVDPDDTLDEQLPDFGLDYSEAEGQAYLAAAIPLYGLEASEYMDQDSINELVLAGGEAICVSLEAGATEGELVESLSSVGMTEGAAQSLLEAAKANLCS